VQSLPQIQADYYVLINSDVEVTPDWITPVINWMENDPKIAACQPKIRSYNEKHLFEYSGACGGFIDKHGFPFCRGRIFSVCEEDHGQYDNPIEIFWATGACLFVKANLYHAVGGLDNDFYAHMEEIDLCWRLKNAGYKITVCPQSVIYHVGGSVMEYGSYTKIYRNYRNNLIMLWKNLPANKVLPVLLIRLILNKIAAFRGLLSGRWTEFRAIFMAQFHFILFFSKWNRKRISSQKLVNQPNTKGIYHQSIVWGFYFRKKRRFQELFIDTN